MKYLQVFGFFLISSFNCLLFTFKFTIPQNTGKVVLKGFFQNVKERPVRFLASLWNDVQQLTYLVFSSRLRLQIERVLTNISL